VKVCLCAQNLYLRHCLVSQIKFAKPHAEECFQSLRSARTFPSQAVSAQPQQLQAMNTVLGI
jgi:hypothetical protein